MSFAKANPLWRGVTWLACLACICCGRPDERTPEEVETTAPAIDYRELEFRNDGLWYRHGAAIPFTGIARRNHPNGAVFWKTKLVDGRAVGRIREWDELENPVWPGRSNKP